MGDHPDSFGTFASEGLVEVKRAGRPTVVLTVRDYFALPVLELNGTEARLFVRDQQGGRVYIVGGLELLVAGHQARRIHDHLAALAQRGASAEVN